MLLSTVSLTPLMRAAAIGHLEVVKAWIDEGVDINERGPRGSTALMYAAAGGHADVVALLLDHEADPTPREQGGWDALDHALADGHEEVAAILRQISCESPANSR